MDPNKTISQQPDNSPVPSPPTPVSVIPVPPAAQTDSNSAPPSPTPTSPAIPETPSAVTTVNTKPVFQGPPPVTAVGSSQTSSFQPSQFTPKPPEIKKNQIKSTVSAKPTSNTSSFTQMTSPDYHPPGINNNSSNHSPKKHSFMFVTLILLTIILGFGGSFAYFYVIAGRGNDVPDFKPTVNPVKIIPTKVSKPTPETSPSAYINHVKVISSNDSYVIPVHEIPHSVTDNGIYLNIFQ